MSVVSIVQNLFWPVYSCERRWLQRAAKIRREQDASNDTASSSTEVKSGKRKVKDVRSPAKDSYDVRLGNAFLDKIYFIVVFYRRSGIHFQKLIY